MYNTNNDNDDFPNYYPLVNVYIAMEHHHFKWVNQPFLWPFSIANCYITRGKLPEGSWLYHALYRFMNIYIYYIHIYILYIFIYILMVLVKKVGFTW